MKFVAILVFYSHQFILNSHAGPAKMSFKSYLFQSKILSHRYPIKNAGWMTAAEECIFALSVSFSGLMLSI